jgi:hypothetical protein
MLIRTRDRSDLNLNSGVTGPNVISPSQAPYRTADRPKNEGAWK